jgi:hypothetical protein
MQTLAMIGFIIGVVALIKGNLSKIKNRKQALGIMLVCFIVFMVSGSKTDINTQNKETKQIKNSASQNIKKPWNNDLQTVMGGLKENLEKRYPNENGSINEIELKTNSDNNLEVVIISTLYNKESNKSNARAIAMAVRGSNDDVVSAIVKSSDGNVLYHANDFSGWK